MRITAVNGYSNQQKMNLQKSNPSFGIKLAIDPNMKYFVQKEALNLASKEGKDAHYYLKDFLGMFIRGMQKFAGFLQDLEPKDMELQMGLTNTAMMYTRYPGLDGNLYSQLTTEKPAYVGFMNPLLPEGNLIAKPVDFPFTEVKAMENMEDVVNLVALYKGLVQHKSN